MSNIRKKPWNRVDLPIYSVSSKGEKDNMNICTYVSAVSLKPKQILVALYHGTQTLINVEQFPYFVLQLLSHHQYRLVNYLGKQSGKHVNKISRLQQRKLLGQWRGFYILHEALAVMKLNAIEWMESSDHRMYLCNLIRYKNLNEGEVLTTQKCKHEGIIR